MFLQAYNRASKIPEPIESWGGALPVVDGSAVNPVTAPNPTTTFTRTNNTIDATKKILIAEAIGAVTYYSKIDRNSDLEVLVIHPWALVAYT